MIDTSTIKLYTNSKITPRKNFIIDDLADYLATLSTPLTLTKFQYIKHALNLEIKIPLDQEYLDYDRTAKYDYCSIQNSDQTKIVYYFVMDMEWRGMNTLKLTLAMDTINTFREDKVELNPFRVIQRDFSFDDKTKINRQHKDRYTSKVLESETIQISGSGYSDVPEYNYVIQDNKWIGRTIDNVSLVINGNFSYTYSFDTNTGKLTIYLENLDQTPASFSFTGSFKLEEKSFYIRKIDLTSEGITPILYGEDISYIESPDNNEWYLVYYGSAVPKCLLFPENPIEAVISGKTTYTLSDFQEGYHYYFMEDRTSGQARTSLTLSSDKVTWSVAFRPAVVNLMNISPAERLCVELYVSSSKLYMRSLTYVQNLLTGQWYFSSKTNPVEIQSVTLNGDKPVAHVINSEQTSLSVIYAAATTYYALTTSTYTLNSFSTLDRTDADLIKIIKLPYPPLDINNVSLSWIYNTTFKCLELSSYDNKMIYNMQVNIDSLWTNPFVDLIMTNTPSVNGERSEENESKLFHSDYYQFKFIYDSFTKVFALERMNKAYFEVLDRQPFELNFVMTNTINSRFLFEFPQYKTGYYSLEDFDNILVCARNNEMTIYNSAYLNYIKTGFNYDVKSKQRQEIGNWIGTGLSIVGSVVSFATSAYTGGAGIAAGVALATSSMAQLTSAVNTTAQAEASQNQKILQLQQQKTSVYGADDVDLMTYYCHNKAKIALYKCSEKMKSVLFDLFFYTGYIDGTMGIPNTISRTRFNFVSCEPVFKRMYNIPEDILSDIELKMNAGVTYIHHYNNEWDLDQRYENWETMFF